MLPLRLRIRDLVLIPLTDENHWYVCSAVGLTTAVFACVFGRGLLVFRRDLNAFLYYDSIKGALFGHAKALATRLAPYCSNQPTQMLLQPTPQQVNDFDCGEPKSDRYHELLCIGSWALSRCVGLYILAIAEHVMHYYYTQHRKHKVQIPQFVLHQMKTKGSMSPEQIMMNQEDLSLLKT